MKTRMLFLGGYLGAGKTILAYHLGKALSDKALDFSYDERPGQRAGGSQFIKNTGVDTREVTGACFCTKPDEFVEHARSLVNVGRPDIIIAEPVGASITFLPRSSTP